MQDVVIQANLGQYTSAAAHFAMLSQRSSEPQYEASIKIDKTVFDHKYLAGGAGLSVLDSIFDWIDSEIRLSQLTQCS